MPSILLRQVGLSIQSPLFENLTFAIGEADRLGLVAGNGGGKTSLLRCLAGQMEPTEGAIVRSRGLRIGYVPQHVPEAWRELSFREMLMQGVAGEEEAWRAEILFDRFEVPEAYRSRAIHALSGGWQRLAAIARTWIAEPDALLMDEPTNHLDLDKIRFLEVWLNEEARGLPVVVASHDRRFLDACTNRTLFLRTGLSKFYAHSYSVARELLRADDEADAVRLEREKKEAVRLRQSAAALKNIGINSGSDTLQKKSKMMRERAEAIEENMAVLAKEKTGTLRLSSRDIQAKTLLSLEKVTVRTPDDRALFQTGSFRLAPGERVAILGANGAGKSRLVALIREAILAPDTVPGIKTHPGLLLGYADQNMSQIPDGETPFGLISTRFDLGDQRCLSLLAGAGFPVETQGRKIGSFSFGQKARLGLLMLRLLQPNFYLLDEPTNHVDIAGLERLEAEILAQDAACILVSHDRRFMQNVATRRLQIEKGKLVEKEPDEWD